MKRGTKIGWALIALSIIISVVVIVAGSSNADQQVGDFILSDDGTVAIQYVGEGGSVSIPDGVVTLDDGLFINNTNITNISMPNTVTYIGTSFASGCSQLQSVSLSNNISSIPANAFRECSGLLSISLPSVSTIGDNAFLGCASLNSISIPTATTSIADTAFSGCDNLEEISVSSGNSNYSSSDGCLYNAARSRLIYVPGGKSSVTIAPSCSTIGQGAFRDAYLITSITIPQTVETMESDALVGSGITTIYGYADSAAETYAKNYNIPFIVIGSDPTPEPDPVTPTPVNPDNPSPAPGSPDNPIIVDNGDGTSTAADGTIIDNATGRIIRSGTGSTGSRHAKDATPATADGVDSIYFLCLAIFLLGVGTIIYTRIRRINLLKKKQ